MPSDRELDQAAIDLQRFRVSQAQHIKSQDDILQQYQALIQDYRRLQADYDEARDSRDNYKRMSKGAERNPFVLVLIDGDGYIFDDDLVSRGLEGGSRAAQLLNEAVKRSLVAKGLEDCRIMVRVYANLAGLSKAVSKVKLCGPEKRSLAPFAASFTRTNDLFDFVDAGELKENADFKFRAMLRQFIDNTQCRQIYVAACHDVGYVSELMPHASKRDRITLIRNHAFHPEFQKLGFPTEHLLPNVFRTTPLGEQLVPQAVSRPAPPPPSNGTVAPDSAPICVFFQKGRCAYGSGCKNRHVRAPIDDIKDWRQKSTTPFDMQPLAKCDHDFVSGRPGSRRSMTQEFDQIRSRRARSQSSNGHVTSQSIATNFEALPRLEDIPQDKVAVSIDQKRLDPYIPTTPEERAAFMAHVAKRKLCNSLHLNGHCPNTESCKYDHSPIDEPTRKCLRAFAFNTPCTKFKDGSCRNLDCNYGHVCQRADCKYRGGKSNCRFTSEIHNIDYHATDFVDGLREENGDLNTVPRPYPPAPDAHSEHGSDRTTAKSGINVEAVAHDDMDALVDAVRAGPRQEALRAREQEEEPEHEVDAAPTWDGRW